MAQLSLFDDMTPTTAPEDYGRPTKAEQPTRPRDDMPLRPYQQEAVDACVAAAKAGHKRILIVAPTGAGKMRVAVELIRRSCELGKCGAFIADQQELVFQAAETFRRLGLPAGMLAAAADKLQAFDVGNLPACCISKDTLYARMKAERINLPQAHTLIFDEAHKSMAATWQQVVDWYSDSWIIGFTATPCRGDGQPLGSMYTAMVKMGDYESLQRDGFLVPCRVMQGHCPDLKGLKVRLGDYARRALGETMNTAPLVGNILDEWHNHAAGVSTVCFASSVEHSIEIRNQFRQRGITAEHIDGGTPDDERQAIISNMNTGATTILCNYGVATTGVDIPRLACMICARPTKSFGLWRQMGGRIQRPAPGKESALILDHAGNTIKHGYPDEDVDWQLDTSMVDDFERKAKAEKQVAEQQEAKAPYQCEACGATYRAPRCPACGHRNEKHGKHVETAIGKLIELERKAATPKAKKAKPGDVAKQHRRAWEQSLYRANRDGMTFAWAARQFKAKTGVLPWKSKALKGTIPSGSKDEWQMIPSQWSNLFK